MDHLEELDQQMAEWEQAELELEQELRHRGLFADRLHTPYTGLERAFAEQWEKENKSDLLKELLSQAGLRVTQRDADVAATVVQWLGSNVGRSFLREAVLKYKTDLVKNEKAISVASVLAETRFDNPDWYEG